MGIGADAPLGKEFSALGIFAPDGVVSDYSCACFSSPPSIDRDVAAKAAHKSSVPAIVIGIADIHGRQIVPDLLLARVDARVLLDFSTRALARTWRGEPEEHNA